MERASFALVLLRFLYGLNFSYLVIPYDWYHTIQEKSYNTEKPVIKKIGILLSPSKKKKNLKSYKSRYDNQARNGNKKCENKKVII